KRETYRTGVKIMSHNFTLNAWLVWISPATSYGYWTREDGSEGGGLWFDHGELVDYDGVFELPAHIQNQIRSLGFQVGSEFA
ncbi:MAG: hypothetical protein ACP5QA_10490, partial [Phycisphaerae bacterium]